MIFTTDELAREGGFAGTAGFRCETAKHQLPFRAFAKVNGANRYSATDYAIAIIIGRLRNWAGQKMQVPVAGRFAELIDRDALEAALQQLEAGEVSEVIVGIPSFGEALEDFSCVFTSREAAVASLSETDLILVDVGEVMQAKFGGLF